MIATRDALASRVTPLARLSRGAWLAIALGGVAVVLGAGGWLVRLHMIDAPYWVLVAWSAALITVALVTVAARRSAAALTVGNIARRLENDGAWRHGALTALLEPPAAGVSETLLASADQAQAASVAIRGDAALAAVREPVRRRALAGMACAAVGFTVIGTAGPVHGPAAALWHPARAWMETTAPVRISASAAAVDRGAPVALTLDALGRHEATLWLRAPGEVWRPQLVSLDSAGHATHAIAALQSDIYARLTSGGRSSDTVVVRVRLPVFLGRLTVTAHYPAYLHLEDEPLPVSGDTIVVPAGTRLDTRGEATAPLRSAAWRAGTAMLPLTVSSEKFEGSIVPTASTEYALALVTTGGAPIGGDTVRLRIRVLPDSAPQIDIPVPGA
ncbi:MAG: DUF4175 family protein, partial [Gemmatimonadota bacterium]